MDVEINPPNPEVSFVKFHLSPVVVSTVESTPTGSSPHVGPSIE